MTSKKPKPRRPIAVWRVPAILAMGQMATKLLEGSALGGLRPVLVALTRGPQIHQELEHGALVHSRHATGSPDGVTFDQRGNDLGAAGGSELVHIHSMLERFMYKSSRVSDRMPDMVLWSRL